jgi:mannosyltransferase
VLSISAVHVVLKSIGVGVRSLSVDETATLWLAVRSPGEVIAASRHYQNPPLYYLLMMGWVYLFGTTETAVRSMSVLVSAVTASAVWLFARRFFGVEAALYSSMLFLASEPQLYYAREARSYALVGLLCVVSFHMFLSTLRRPAWTKTLLLGVINAAAAYTHYTVILAFVPQFAVAFASLVWPARRRGALFVISGLAVAFSLFAPWIPTLWQDIPQTGQFWLDAPTRAQAEHTMRELVGGSAALGLQLIVLAVSLSTAAATRAGSRRASVETSSRIASETADRNEPLSLLTVAMWAVLPVAAALCLSTWTPIFSLRYLLFASLGWMLLTAALLARLPLPQTARSLVALVLGLLSAIHLDWSKSRSADWRRATELAVAQRSGQTAILIAPSWQCLPFSYYLDRYAFPVEARRLLALETTGVRCLSGPDDVDISGLQRPDRLVIVRSEGVTHRFAPLVQRMPAFGYARGVTMAFRGGREIVFDRVDESHEREQSITRNRLRRAGPSPLSR